MSSLTFSLNKKAVQQSVVEISDDITIASSRDSHIEKQDESSQPPNGGLLAWLQILGSFFLWFNTW